ncbi:hypothetical protein [Candidatus Protochlamydia naegleriophila]|uniref:hypothetical protein n=1 Tax=Candidatus Protochlamydia naegleriophila TaxID=389348 RepID=UPI00130171DD
MLSHEFKARFKKNLMEKLFLIWTSVVYLDTSKNRQVLIICVYQSTDKISID